MLGRPAATTEEKLANWRMLFRQLAELHDWPPQVIAQWTYYQCRMMVCNESELTGKVKMSREQAERIRARGPYQKKFLRAFRSMG